MLHRPILYHASFLPCSHWLEVLHCKQCEADPAKQLHATIMPCSKSNNCIVCMCYTACKVMVLSSCAARASNSGCTYQHSCCHHWQQHCHGQPGSGLCLQLHPWRSPKLLYLCARLQSNLKSVRHKLCQRWSGWPSTVTYLGAKHSIA